MKTSTTIALSLLLSLTPLALEGCKKDGDSTTPDDAASTTGDAPDDGGDEGPEVVPQDPDPPELAQALQSFVLGDMAAVTGATEPLMGTLTEPSQARANGIASALFALATAEDLAENAQEPAENALAKANEVHDPEVLQLAHIALGAHHVGVGDGAAAQTEFEAALAESGPNTALANLYLAQAHVAQAFDESDKLVNPGKLDEAAAAYQAAIDGSEDAGIKGRGLSGLAAVAKFRGKLADVCTHAAAAAEQLTAAGANAYLTEVPSILSNDAKCK